MTNIELWDSVCQTDPMSTKGFLAFAKKTFIRFDIECWVFKTLGNDGYGKIKINGKTVRAHRFSYEFYNNRKIKSSDIVRHKCDNRACVNPDHLEIGTVQDNVNDTWSRNRGNPQRGENSSASKLTADEVLEIRKCAQSGETHESISNRYKVSRGNITKIINQTRWTHI